MNSFGRCCKEIFGKLRNSPLAVSPNKNPLTFLKTRNSYFKQNLCSFQGENKEELKIDYEAIVKNDKDLENKLKVIILEAEVLRQEGHAVPPVSYFSSEQWKEALNLPTRSARRRYFEFLFKLSKTTENKLAKKEKKRLEWEELKKKKSQEPKIDETFEDFALQHDLQHNNILLRIYDTTINQMYNNRLIQAIMFGQKLVIDCGYDSNMTRRENLNCAKQLMLLFSENRFHDDPFDLYFCNANQRGDLMKYVNKFMPTLYEPWFPLNVHSCSYLDIFPKSQLVYLTPHCREELQEFDHEAVYIIGGIVDKMNSEPLSLAKAKREGLKMAKLPLDRYLQWGAGSGKSLTLNQVTSILLDAKKTGNWEIALRHVPRRKLMDYNQTDGTKMNSFNMRNERHSTKKWIPSANIKFGNLGYNRSDKNEEKRRLLKIKSILNE
nr:mitochondrial ribonuclease P protein 1 homolog [Leptinotarsa decemlineata]